MVMMFLQFFVWGAWYTTIAVYMTQQGMGTLTHWPFTVNPVAAIVAPFFVGLVADRYFATEKVFAALTEPDHLRAWFPTDIIGERATPQ